MTSTPTPITEATIDFLRDYYTDEHFQVEQRLADLTARLADAIAKVDAKPYTNDVEDLTELIEDHFHIINDRELYHHHANPVRQTVWRAQAMSMGISGEQLDAMVEALRNAPSNVRSNDMKRYRFIADFFGVEV